MLKIILYWHKQGQNELCSSGCLNHLPCSNKAFRKRKKDPLFCLSVAKPAVCKCTQHVFAKYCHLCVWIFHSCTLRNVISMLTLIINHNANVYLLREPPVWGGSTVINIQCKILLAVSGSLSVFLSLQVMHIWTYEESDLEFTTW